MIESPTGLPDIPNPPAPPPVAQPAPMLNPTVLIRAVMAQWYDGQHYQRGATIPMRLSDVQARSPGLVQRL